MDHDEGKMTLEECAFEVRLMARRLALLHYFFAETLVNELGEERGKQLVSQAIQAYGEYCGRAIREGLEEMGLPNTPENMGKIRDLPRAGWEGGTSTGPNGETRPTVTYCPLAVKWQKMGPRAVEFGRLYCHVDQAKQDGFNPDYEFIHTRNVLDGDPCCEFLVRQRNDL